MAVVIIPVFNSEPPPVTANAYSWQDRLDHLDPFFGDPDQLAELVASAPTPELAAWLTERIAQTRQFITQIQQH